MASSISAAPSLRVQHFNYISEVISRGKLVPAGFNTGNPISATDRYMATIIKFFTYFLKVQNGDEVILYLENSVKAIEARRPAEATSQSYLSMHMRYNVLYATLAETITMVHQLYGIEGARFFIPFMTKYHNLGPVGAEYPTEQRIFYDFVRDLAGRKLSFDEFKGWINVLDSYIRSEEILRDVLVLGMDPDEMLNTAEAAARAATAAAEEATATSGLEDESGSDSDLDLEEDDEFGAAAAAAAKPVTTPSPAVFLAGIKANGGGLKKGTPKPVDDVDLKRKNRFKEMSELSSLIDLKTGELDREKDADKKQVLEEDIGKLVAKLMDIDRKLMDMDSNTDPQTQAEGYMNPMHKQALELGLSPEVVKDLTIVMGSPAQVQAFLNTLKGNQDAQEERGFQSPAPQPPMLGSVCAPAPTPALASVSVVAPAPVHATAPAPVIASAQASASAQVGGQFR